MKSLFLGILLLCVASPVFCGEEGKVFTNEDLHKYTKKDGATVYPAPETKKSKKHRHAGEAKRENATQKKKEYYCSYGVKYKRAMDEAEHSLKRCQDKFYEKRKAAHFRISENRDDCEKKKTCISTGRRDVF
jgi:hypothetical protein